MGLKLQWRVLRSDLPPHLKPLALVLALIAKDDGSSLYVRVERLAEYLGLHRVTVSRQLEELRREGVLTTERRSGRRRATQRKFHAEALPAAGMRSADATEKSDGLRSTGATRLVDDVALTLRNRPDSVAPALPIKPFVRTTTLTKNIEPSVRPHDGAQTAPCAADASAAVGVEGEGIFGDIGNIFGDGR